MAEVVIMELAGPPLRRRCFRLVEGKVNMMEVQQAFGEGIVLFNGAVAGVEPQTGLSRDTFTADTIVKVAIAGSVASSSTTSSSQPAGGGLSSQDASKEHRGSQHHARRDNLLHDIRREKKARTDAAIPSPQHHLEQTLPYVCQQPHWSHEIQPVEVDCTVRITALGMQA